ncbi:hypothetical protein HYPSUDRAFT_422075 [Hypholoma sublateritium FD-334 SS-4]|uniref:Protein kinase domain-containing protein n=1 Tax=Hypholoma sublateritium (strain FD-334 SS-4) TaxID=945553 RepID=A0A0D2Q196_HYPSF|nr:hypothetical protein HYPSUDRAFT_422075 [Hypholoma sublateritium FD-334 SS-4]
MCDLRDFLPRLEGKGEARALLAQIVLALATIHAIGMTHGDIKPENVMVDRSGNIKLMDFGSSYVRPTAAPLERSTVHPSVVFTLAYAAPERYAGTSPATDYWSLGCLFYELAMRTESERPKALGDNVLFELIDLRRWVEGYRNGDNLRSHLPQDGEVLDSDSLSLLSGLLCPNPGCRFTIDDMLNHAYFANINRRDRTMSEFQRLRQDLYKGDVNSFSDRQAKYLDTAAQNVVARQKILIQTDRYNLWLR